jgi:hypothetical protein
MSFGFIVSGVVAKAAEATTKRVSPALNVELLSKHPVVAGKVVEFSFRLLRQPGDDKPLPAKVDIEMRWTRRRPSDRTQTDEGVVILEKPVGPNGEIRVSGKTPPEAISLQVRAGKGDGVSLVIPVTPVESLDIKRVDTRVAHDYFLSSEPCRKDNISQVVRQATRHQETNDTPASLNKQLAFRIPVGLTVSLFAVPQSSKSGPAGLAQCVSLRLSYKPGREVVATVTQHAVERSQHKIPLAMPAWDIK